MCLQVCTGVYHPGSALQQAESAHAEVPLCGHRDQVLEPELVKPRHVVEDVEAAVDLVLQENADTFWP